MWPEGQLLLLKYVTRRSTPSFEVCDRKVNSSSFSKYVTRRSTPPPFLSVTRRSTPPPFLSVWPEGQLLGIWKSLTWKPAPSSFPSRWHKGELLLFRGRWPHLAPLNHRRPVKPSDLCPEFRDPQSELSPPRVQWPLVRTKSAQSSVTSGQLVRTQSARSSATAAQSSPVFTLSQVWKGQKGEGGKTNREVLRILAWSRFPYKVLFYECLFI